MSDYTPTDLANQALDAAGVETTIGDIEEGTREAQVCLRQYRHCLQQLLRAAHWDFARQTAPLQLLADATGNTPLAGTIVPVPWVYEYAYPNDCLKVRFIPWNPLQSVATPPGNIAISTTVPLSTALTTAQPGTGQRLRPSRFVIATDYNYPVQAGTDVTAVQGVSPVGRTVILTNVPNAQCIYTAYVNYPSQWDPNFRAALVAYLASEIALPLSKDKKFGLTLRAQNIAIAKGKIMEARVSNGNESWSSSDIKVDWIQTRYSGYAWGWGDGQGPGNLWGGWDNCSFGDGTAY